jgi:hypothetical protein
MSIETIIAMAIAMGRTLVMPPKHGIYRLGGEQADDTKFTLYDFYDMQQIEEYLGLDVISMEDFLLTEAMVGHLNDESTGEVTFPPHNRTDWNGVDSAALKKYLRRAAFTPSNWMPGWCLAAFPSGKGPAPINEMKALMRNATNNFNKFPKWREYDKKQPMPVDSPANVRLREMVSGGIGGSYKRLCIYNETMQQSPVLHIMSNGKSGVRMMTHFYSFLFFPNWREDVWIKRFARDKLRYNDSIQCAAARIVSSLRERARQRDPIGNPNGEYDSFHIRRGDFYCKHVISSGYSLHLISTYSLTAMPCNLHSKTLAWKQKAYTTIAKTN